MPHFNHYFFLLISQICISYSFIDPTCGLGKALQIRAEERISILSNERSIKWMKADAEEISYAEISDKLLSLLLQVHQRSDPIGESTAQQIESLISSLSTANVPFDPQVSLNGPLFVVLYQKGPVPSWEKYTRIFTPNGKKNLKGQRYVAKIEDGETIYDVTNYAEILGNGVHITASGVCIKDANESVDKLSQKPGNFFSNLFRKAPLSFENPLLTTPQDYTVTANGVGFSVLGKKFDFALDGVGYMRMLYADPTLRILTNREDSVGIDEKNGLTVAQVRVDLVDPSFSLE